MKFPRGRALALGTALAIVLGLALRAKNSPPSPSPTEETESRQARASASPTAPGFEAAAPAPAISPEPAPEENPWLRQAEATLPTHWPRRGEARVTQRGAQRLEIAIFYDNVRIEMSESHFLRAGNGAWEPAPFVRELPTELPDAFPPWTAGRGEREIPLQLEQAGIPHARVEEMPRSWWKNPQGQTVPCANYLVRAKKPDGFPLEEMWCLDARSGEVARRLSLLDH